MQWNLSDNNVFKPYFFVCQSVLHCQQMESLQRQVMVFCAIKDLILTLRNFISSWHNILDFFLHWTDWVAGIWERVSELGQNGMDDTERCVPCVYCVLATVYLYLWNCCLSMEAGSTQGYSGKGIVKSYALCSAASCDMYDNI